MSQHRFMTQCQGRPVAVVLGWDRPLGGHFMMIEWMDCPAESEELFLYSNLDDPRLNDVMGFPAVLTPFLDELHRLGIEVPAEMIANVEADKQRNAGNVFKLYQTPPTTQH